LGTSLIEYASPHAGHRIRYRIATRQPDAIVEEQIETSSASAKSARRVKQTGRGPAKMNNAALFC
jgi:hypothetical protein